MRTLADIPRLGAKRHPHKPALVMDGVTLTYTEFNRRVNRAAGGLLKSGLGRGDRVALLSRNRIEFAIAAFAVFKAGATLIPLNFRYSAAEIARVLTQARPRLLFAGPEETSLAQAGAAEADVDIVHLTGDGVGTLAALEATGSDDEPDADVRDDDIAWVQFTSGTTGAPCGILASHRGVVRSLAVYAIEGDLRESDVMLLCIPMFHGGGLGMQLVPALAFGATVVITGGSFEPARILATVAREGVTVAHWAPAMLAMLVTDCDPNLYDVGCLRSIWYGSSSIDPVLLGAVQDRFPSAGLYQWYGSTETMTIAVLRPADHAGPASHAQRTGREVHTMDCRVVNPDGHGVADGEVGEVVASVDSASWVGYLDGGNAPRTAARDGWLHTGDLARRDADGYLTVVDRMNDMIVSGGENIYPREVEHAIATHPAIAEVAVFGGPDEKYGEGVCAAVVCRAGIDRPGADDIIAWCEQRIARYKRPRRVFFLDELPRNATGKVLKRELKPLAVPPLQPRGHS